MKLLLLCALISTINAKPEGYFRQEYQFKKSSSTFQNNELQTKNEDEGFYAKHGDLEGQTPPKVNQHSEHREFINPKLDGVGHTVTTYGNRDLTQEAEGVFANHGMMTPSNNYGGGRSHSYSSFSSFSTSGQTSNQPKTYVTHSNLGQLTQNLEYDLSKQLRDATSKYSTHSINSEDLRILESELKANLTRQLNEALYNKYGRQGQSGSFSYSISTSGGYNPQANYDNQELTDLSKQVEQNLIKQLHENVRTTTHYQTGTRYIQTPDVEDIRHSNTHRRDSAEIEDLNRRSYYPKPDDNLQQNTERITYASALNAHMVPESSHTTAIRTDSYRSQTSNHQQQYRPRPEDFPQLTQTTERVVIQPSISITDVAQRVQNDLSQQLNTILRTYEEKYTNSDYLLTHTRPSYQNALDDFKRELRYNITRQLNDELQKNYGNQVQRGEYSFSTGSRTVANYRINDFNNLKKQVEDNLINHLENTLKQQENRFVARRQQSQTKTYHSQNPTYTRTLTDEAANTRHISGAYSQHSPVYTRPLTDENYGTRNTQTQTTFTRTSSHQTNPELQQITNQVQDDLTQKIQAAVQKQRSSYTTTYNDQNNQALIDELSEELKRNLTKSLRESLRERYGEQGTRGGYSYSVSTSGTYSPKANYNREDLDALMRQMQADLERQLREQMSQKSYQSQSQYSSYGPVRYTTYRTNNYYPAQTHSGSFQKYEQFNSGFQTKNTENLEDCMQGDAPAGSPGDHKINKRESSYLKLLPQQEDDYDFVQQEIGQQPEDDFDQLGQQIEDDFGQLHQGQQVEDDFGQIQVGQQIEDGFDKLQIGQQVEDDLRQQQIDFERLQVPQQVGQQTQDDFEKLEVGQQIEDNFGELKPGQQQVEDDLGQLQVGQQIEDDFGQLQVGQQIEDDIGQLQVGQQIEHLGQQTEDDFEKLQVGQEIEDDLGKHVGQVQQIEDDYQILGQHEIGVEDFDKLHIGQSMVHQDEELTQQIEDLDKLTQQTEDSGFGKLEFTNQEQHIEEEGQQIQNLDQLIQQIEDEDYAKLKVENQNNQLNKQDFNNVPQQEDLTQQIENIAFPKHTEGFGKLQLENTTPKSNLELVNSGELTQQLPQDFFGNLQNGTNHTVINKDITHMQANANSQPSRAISLGDAHRTYINRPIDAYSPREIDVSKQNDLQLTQQQEQVFPQTENVYRVQPPRNTYHSFGHPEDTQRIEEQTPRNIFSHPPYSSGYNYHRVQPQRNTYHSFEHPKDNQQIEESTPRSVFSRRPYSSGYNEHRVHSFGYPEDTQQMEEPTPRSIFSHPPYSSGYNKHRVHSFGHPEDTQQMEEPTPRSIFSHPPYSSGYNEHRVHSFGYPEDTQQMEEPTPRSIFSHPPYSSGYNDHRVQPQRSHSHLPYPSLGSTDPRMPPQRNSYHSWGHSPKSIYSHPPYSNEYNQHRFENTDDTQQIEKIAPPKIYHTYSSGYRSTNLDDNQQIEKDDTQQVEEIQPISENEDLQQEIEPVAVPNSHPQGRRIEPETDAMEEEFTEETTPQTGFWKRVGGKISNTYNSAKQKAKDLVEKMNM